MKDPFQEQIIQAMSARFSGATVELEGPISIRDYSEIFRARIGVTPPLTAAVKRCFVSRTTTPDQAAAKDQYLALEKVSEALAKLDPRYSIPTPLFIDTELATFGMSWVEGQSLTKKMHEVRIIVDGPKWFESAGAWLGSFHKTGPLRTGLFNCAERIDTVSDLLNHPLPDKSFVHASRILSKNLSNMTNIPVQISWLHGDCKTDNFMIGKNTIFGIDISLVYENAIEYDIAQFLNHLEMLFSSPRNPHLSAMKSCLKAAFWHGYRTTGPAVSFACLNWVRLWACLSLWRSMLIPRKRGISTWLLNRMFAKLAQELARKIN